MIILAKAVNQFANFLFGNFSLIKKSIASDNDDGKPRRT